MFEVSEFPVGEKNGRGDSARFQELVNGCFGTWLTLWCHVEKPRDSRVGAGWEVDGRGRPSARDQQAA